MYFYFLAHFAITSLVVFAELSILLCYEVFVLKFYLQRFNLRLIFVRHFVCPGPAQFCLAMNKSDYCGAIVNFVLIFMFRDRIGLYSVLLPSPKEKISLLRYNADSTFTLTFLKPLFFRL